jgi:hypothetical protein
VIIECVQSVLLEVIDKDAPRFAKACDSLELERERGEILPVPRRLHPCAETADDEADSRRYNAFRCLSNSCKFSTK